MDFSKLQQLTKNKRDSLKQKTKTIKPNPGANRYILLPGWRKGEEHVWWHDFGQHYVKNAAGEIQAVYPCVDKTYGNPCPVCEGLQKAIRATTDDDTVKALKEAASKQSFLMNVLALDAEDDATPQILEVGKAVYGQIADLIEEWGAAIFDPASPQVFVINREGKGLNTKYSVQVSPKKHTLPKGVLEKINDLDEYVRQENEDQQRRALNAINNVAGLLPSADKPRTASSTLDMGTGTGTGDAGDGDLRDLEARRDAAGVKPTTADIALDDELDDLLGDLTGTE